MEDPKDIVKEKDHNEKIQIEESVNSKYTILKVKRKRNDAVPDSILLEERPTKFSKQFENALSAFSGLSLTNTQPATNQGRKLFRYIGMSDDKQPQLELLSRKSIAQRVAVMKSKHMKLQKQERIILQQNAAKRARQLIVNKLRKLDNTGGQHYSLFELIPQETKKKTIILDNLPRTGHSVPEQTDEVTHFYYLDNEGPNHDEVSDTTIVPVESFSEINDENGLTYENEYDEEVSDPAEDSDSQNAIDDYPETPDSAEEQESWKDDTSEDKESHSSDDGTRGYGSYKFKHGYDVYDSDENYDEYL